jgi:tetratricopeptide (TPR) repeat protein
MRARFDLLLKRAEEAFSAGELFDAVDLASQAEALATSCGEVDLADHAFCNRCAFLIELDRGHEQIPKLKQILLRSADPMNRWRAAYYTSVAYDHGEELDKASSYAQRARELAVECAEPASRAASANLVATLALRASQFDGAEAAYREALALYEDLDGYHRIMAAQVEDNLGYVLMCLDRLDDGLGCCERALKALEKLDADHYLHQTLQDLCYGYLLADRLEQAKVCGERALDLAVDADDGLVVKNTLFLLSEIAVRRGDTFGARRYLHELTAYYPEAEVSEEIIDVFLATDLTTVVNLRG